MTSPARRRGIEDAVITSREARTPRTKISRYSRIEPKEQVNDKNLTIKIALIILAVVAIPILISLVWPLAASQGSGSSSLQKAEDRPKVAVTQLNVQHAALILREKNEPKDPLQQVLAAVKEQPTVLAKIQTAVGGVEVFNAAPKVPEDKIKWHRGLTDMIPCIDPADMNHYFCHFAREGRHFVGLKYRVVGVDAKPQVTILAQRNATDATDWFAYGPTPCQHSRGGFEFTFVDKRVFKALVAFARGETAEVGNQFSSTQLIS